MLKQRTNLSLLLLLFCVTVLLPLKVQSQETSRDVLGSLRFRFIGPTGNRLTSVVGIPGDSNTYYVGAASGGVWKTVDAGVHWEPIFDSEPVSSIGSLAVAPSDPNIVWAGTGEPWLRSHISVGQGVYKSTDAGKTCN